MDPKDNHTNKFRYMVASNDTDVRKHMRSVAGVPLIYISKSVLLMEPMANASEELREREEKSKFKMGLKGQRKPDVGAKRKRNDEEAQDGASVGDKPMGTAKPAKKQKGPKGPNPLSVKKAKKEQGPPQPKAVKRANSSKTGHPPPSTTDAADPSNQGDDNDAAPRKRRRKHKSKADSSVAVDGEEAGSP